MRPPPRWIAGLVAALALNSGCRDAATPIAPDDVGSLGVDAPVALDAPVGMDAAVADDAVTVEDTVTADEAVTASDASDLADAGTLVDARSDARTPDAGRSCACPSLPMACSLPPLDAPSFSAGGALLGQLIGLIACADTSLHVALYETLWSCVPEAILARLEAAPSLTVQLVYDDETCPRVAGVLMCPLARLDGHPRVSLLPDGRSALMHHKFFVVDGEQVWVGSANSSEQSYCRDANDAVLIGEPAIVAAFEGEFQRMFREHAFGPIVASSPATAGRYAAYFSPRSPTSSPARWFTDMVGAINEARTSVDFVISAWTRTELSDAMIAARARGVMVRGIVAREYLNDAPAMALLAAGVPVRSGDVHSKLLILDGQTVITGSANWSAAAWANNENSLWIRDAAAAGAYGEYFTRQYATATVPTGM
jgi:hypothetical protein